MSNNNVSLHRVIKTSPDKLYRAFTDPVALSSWSPPYGYMCTVQQFECKPGGTYRMTFINFSTGTEQAFEGKFIALEPGHSLQYVEKFDDPNLQGEMVTTVKISSVSTGAALNILQENIPSAIPAEMCYLGWQDSLEKLMNLVEPDTREG